METKLTQEQMELLSELVKRAIGKYSVNEIARRAGIAKGVISHWINCKNGIRTETFEKLAKVSEENTEELMQEFFEITKRNLTLKTENEDNNYKDVLVILEVESEEEKERLFGKLITIIAKKKKENEKIKIHIISNQYFKELEYFKNLFGEENIKIEIS